MTKFRRSVTLLAVILSLVIAGLATGGVVGSKHDISTGNTPDACVFCHTPHSSNPSVGAPLWNRFIGAGVTFTPYQRSSTMTSTPSSAPNPASLACLSCHDGVMASSDKHELWNAPGAGAVGPGTDHSSSPNCDRCHTEQVTGLPSKVHIPGTDLRNDHPISMTYPLNNPNFVIPPDPQNGWIGNDLKLYGGSIECPTCHDVHTPNVVPFLRKRNDGSVMCLTCHLK